MDLAGLLVGLCYIVSWSSLIKVHCYGILSRINLKGMGQCHQIVIQKGMGNKLTLITGGGEENSLRFSVKSSTLSVADIITSFNGGPFCKEIKTKRTHP